MTTIIHSSYEHLRDMMDVSTIFGICAIIIGVCGLIIAIINLIINKSNRRMNAFRLAFDIRYINIVIRVWV